MIQSMKVAYQATAPHTFAYVISRDESERMNVMGLSWWTFVSSQPPMLLICISRKKHTITNIEKTREFSLCIPDISLREQAMTVCSCSGADVDKVAEFGIELESAKVIKTPLLKKARAKFECKVTEIIDGGDHAICLAEIVDYSTDLNCEALRTRSVGYAL